VGKISQYIITRHLVEFIVYEFWGRCRNRQKKVPKRTKVAKKTYIVIPILRTTSGGGAETEKIGAENAKIQSAEKSAETGGNRQKHTKLLPRIDNMFLHVGLKKF
jgi:hypothetical protein